MDEALKQAILQARLQQGILGGRGGVLDLQPIWNKMNIDRQAQGFDPLPQYTDWYQMVHQQYPQLFQGQAPNQGEPQAPQPMGGTPADAVLPEFGGNPQSARKPYGLLDLLLGR